MANGLANEWQAAKGRRKMASERGRMRREGSGPKDPWGGEVSALPNEGGELALLIVAAFGSREKSGSKAGQRREFWLVRREAGAREIFALLEGWEAPEGMGGVLTHSWGAEGERALETLREAGIERFALAWAGQPEIRGERDAGALSQALRDLTEREGAWGPLDMEATESMEPLTLASAQAGLAMKEAWEMGLACAPGAAPLPGRRL